MLIHLSIVYASFLGLTWHWGDNIFKVLSKGTFSIFNFSTLQLPPTPPPFSPLRLFWVGYLNWKSLDIDTYVITSRSLVAVFNFSLFRRFWFLLFPGTSVEWFRRSRNQWLLSFLLCDCRYWCSKSSIWRSSKVS